MLPQIPQLQKTQCELAKVMRTTTIFQLRNSLGRGGGHLIKSVVFKIDSNEWVIVIFFIIVDVNNDRGHSKKSQSLAM